MVTKRLILVWLVLSFVLLPVGQAAGQDEKAKAQVLFMQAFEFFQAGEYDAAVIGFKEGLVLDPSSGLGHFYLAETYARQNRLDLALQHYEQTVRLEPDSTEALMARSRTSALAPSRPPQIAAGKNPASPRRAHLGVTLQPLTAALADSFALPKSQGALVVAVNRGGAADKAGIISGDVILAFNGRIIGDAADLSREVARTMPSMTVTLTVWRNKARRSIRASLGEAP